MKILDLIQFPFAALYISDESIELLQVKIEADYIAFAKAQTPKVSDKFHFKNTTAIIDSKEIISNEVVSETAEDALDEAFPAIRRSDIYYEFIKTGEYNRISIIKKEALDKILENHELIKRGIQNINLSTTIRIFSTKKTAPLKDELAEIAIGLRLKGIQSQNNWNDINSLASESLFNNRFYDIVKWSAIAFFLIGLTVNFLYHEQYRKQLEEARVTVQTFSNLSEKIESLKDEVNTNEALLISNNYNDRKRVRLLNEILLRDRSIIFNSVGYQPLKATLKSGQQARLLSDQLIVEGSASSKMSLDSYLNYLRSNEYLKDYSVVKITESKKSVEFELILYLNETR